MPPRYVYWTILIDNKPTAFRARDKEELLPTLYQLKRKNTDVVMKWFARGRLWDTPEQAQWAARSLEGTREKRGRDWRPGGQHEDPRARFDKRRKEDAARKKTDVAQVFRPASSKPGWHNKPKARSTGQRPWAGKPPRASQRPWPNKGPQGAQQSGKPDAAQGFRPARKRDVGQVFRPARKADVAQVSRPADSKRGEAKKSQHGWRAKPGGDRKRWANNRGPQFRQRPENPHKRGLAPERREASMPPKVREGAEQTPKRSEGAPEPLVPPKPGEGGPVPPKRSEGGLVPPKPSEGG